VPRRGCSRLSINRVRIQIFSLSITTRPRPYAYCCTATHRYIMILLLYSPPESLSVSRSTTAQIIIVLYTHTHTHIVVILLLLLCASSRVKNLIIQIYNIICRGKVVLSSLYVLRSYIFDVCICWKHTPLVLYHMRMVAHLYIIWYKIMYNITIKIELTARTKSYYYYK